MVVRETLATTVVVLVVAVLLGAGDSNMFALGFPTIIAWAALRYGRESARANWAKVAPSREERFITAGRGVEQSKRLEV